MAATTTYTIDYGIPAGIPTVTTLLLSYKVNNGVYTTLDTQINPAIGLTYNVTTGLLPSHSIYTVKAESFCGDLTPYIGDYWYLMNLVCNIGTGVAAVGPSIDVSWDSYIDATSGESLKEYILEYKDNASLGPWTSIAITKANILAYWVGNPYPGYTHNIVAGINPATTYNLRLTTILNYDYVTVSGDVSTDVVIGPCPINDVVIP